MIPKDRDTPPFWPIAAHCYEQANHADTVFHLPLLLDRRSPIFQVFNIEQTPLPAFAILRAA
jgi:hypothetical protein